MIGSLIVALFLNAAYNRPAQRKQFHLYADEFQRFATEDFATLLEEARKFAIATTIAHQNRSQLDAENKQLETNLKDRSRSVGNLVVFRVNSRDAEDLAGEFDVTPEEAWEEELEEEWLEIREHEDTDDGGIEGRKKLKHLSRMWSGICFEAVHILILWSMSLHKWLHSDN